MGLFKGHNTVTRADKISNFTVATAEYGAPVMEILGTTRISGNVIYYDDFTAHEHVETQRTGKGGKSTATNITYTYTVACILGLCEGPISKIGRIWVNKEIYTYPSSNIPLTLFNGAEGQQPWSYVVGKHPERALAYEGLAYMAGVIDLGSSASMPSYNFEVFGKLLSTGDGTDVNPMDYIKFVLSKVGQGNVTIAGESNFRNYCANADLLISTPSEATGTKEAREIANDIAELCGAYVFWSNDAYKIVPLADRPVGGWEPDKTIRYNLTPDDFHLKNGSCVTWARKDSSEQYNRFTVEFQNRENNYEKESVTYEDVADIAERGVKQAPTIQAGYVYTKARAVMIAEAAARRNKVEKNQYQFELGWAFCRLEPGDLVRITDEASGIVNQVVLIKSIQEAANGFLQVTAVSWFQDDYGAAEYDVHEVDKPDIDFNAPPGNTAAPAIFQPPADITSNGLEVWIGAKGVSENWGGCSVYVSDDNEHYRTLGQITNSARLGSLVANIAADATSMEVDINGTLLSGTEQDAERANTLLWVDGECISYQTATLLQNGHYQLSGLVRGQYNTAAAVHSSGSAVVRCDEALLRVPFSKEDIGKHVWLKFCSYNIFGAGEQSLADVQAYEYTIQAYYVPPVQNLTARNRYRQLKDGVNRYDVVVEWTPPDLLSYLEGRVWYKTNALQSKDLSMASLKVSELGFNENWIFGGSGKDTVTLPQAIVGDTYKIAVTTVDIWGVETSPDASPQVTIKVMLKTELPNTPDGFGIEFGTAAVVSWKEVTNTDIAFYEIRKDMMPGVESGNLLARVTGLTAALTLASRTGRLYLYAYSASGKYSAPAVLDYNKAAPPKPLAPTLSAKLGGFSLVAGEIPSGCNGMNIYIDGGTTLVQAHTVNNVYTYTCDAGVYDVSVAYTDIFGEGAHSNESTITVKILVDSALLDQQAVTKQKLDLTLQASIDDIATLQADVAAIDTVIDTQVNAAIDTLEAEIDALDTQVNADIDAITTELNKAPSSCGYQAIQSLNTADGTLSSTIANNKTAQDAVNAAQADINAGTATSGLKTLIQTNATNITQNATDITSVAARVTTAEGQLAGTTTSALKTAINQNATDITSLASRVTTTEGQLAGTSTSALKTAINQNAESITSLATRVTTTEGELAGTSTSGLKTLIESNTTAITQNATDISSLATRVTTTEGQLAGTTTSALKTAINQNASDITSLATRVDTTEDQLDMTTGTTPSTLQTTLQTAINQNASDITSLATRVTTAEGQLAGTTTSALQTAITQNASGLTAVSSRVDTVEDQLDMTAGTTPSTLQTTLQTAIGVNASGISAIISNLSSLSDAQTAYTAFSALAGMVALRLTQGDMETYLQADHTGIYIKGSLLSIDGDTVINAAGAAAVLSALQAGSITTEKLAAGAVTADKITIGTSSGNRLVLSSNLLRVIDSNGIERVKLGVWT